MTTGSSGPPLEPSPARPPTGEPVSLDKAGAEPPLDFDPYRFGAPAHPVPPEYAPPGYRPPPPTPPAPPPYAGGPHGGAAHRGYGQQPYPMPPAPAGFYGAPRPGHGKATASLILGLGSILLCWLSILDAIPVLLAIIFGVLALDDAKKNPSAPPWGGRPPRSGRGMAIAGIACALVGAILATVLSLYLYNRFKDCFDYPAGSEQYKTCITDKL